MEIYRGGIMDKTRMYETDLRTGRHDFSIWVLFFNLALIFSQMAVQTDHERIKRQKVLPLFAEMVLITKLKLMIKAGSRI